MLKNLSEIWRKNCKTHANMYKLCMEIEYFLHYSHSYPVARLLPEVARGQEAAEDAWPFPVDTRGPSGVSKHLSCKLLWWLTLLLLVANVAITKWYKKPEKWLKSWHMGDYSVRAIQRIPIWQAFNGFQKSLHPCTLDKFKVASALSGLKNPFMLVAAKTARQLLVIYLS